MSQRFSPPVESRTFYSGKGKYDSAYADALLQLNNWKQELEVSSGGRVHIYNINLRQEIPRITIYYSLVMGAEHVEPDDAVRTLEI